MQGPRTKIRAAAGAPVLAATLAPMLMLMLMLTLTLALALGAGSAHASEASKIIERCGHGESLSGFSQNGYRKALKQMPTYVVEYSDCANRIRKAELAAAGGGGGGSTSEATGTAPLPLTSTERQKVVAAHSHGSAPVRIGQQAVQPGVVHANVASVTSALPTSLQTALGVLLAGALALGGVEAYKRVRARRHR